MAEVLKMRFLVRSHTAADWTALNEVLLASTGGTGAREMGMEEDTGRYKLGDGVTPWNSLPYQAGGTGGVNQQTGTSYTFATSDVEQTVICSNASAVAITIPANASAPIPVGAKIAYTQGGTGKLTITGASGVTVHAPNGNTTGAAYDGGVAEKIGTDEWQLWNGPALGPLASAADAPNNGTPYVRQSAGWVSASSGSGGIIAMNEQTGTSYTLVLADATKAVRCTNAAAIALTIPTNASVALPLYTPIPVFQGGAGAVTISGASGVTLESPNGAATSAVGDFRTLFQRAANVWVIG